MKTFCYSCGKGNTYLFDVPKYCSFCGEKFNMATASVQESKNNDSNDLFSFEDLHLNKMSFLEVISIEDDGTL